MDYRRQLSLTSLYTHHGQHIVFRFRSRHVRQSYPRRLVRYHRARKRKTRKIDAFFGGLFEQSTKTNLKNQKILQEINKNVSVNELFSPKILVKVQLTSKLKEHLQGLELPMNPPIAQIRKSSKKLAHMLYPGDHFKDNRQEACILTTRYKAAGRARTQQPRNETEMQTSTRARTSQASLQQSSSGVTPAPTPIAGPAKDKIIYSKAAHLIPPSASMTEAISSAPQAYALATRLPSAQPPIFPQHTASHNTPHLPHAFSTTRTVSQHLPTSAAFPASYPPPPTAGNYDATQAFLQMQHMYHQLQAQQQLLSQRIQNIIALAQPPGPQTNGTPPSRIHHESPNNHPIAQPAYSTPASIQAAHQQAQVQQNLQNVSPPLQSLGHITGPSHQPHNTRHSSGPSTRYHNNIALRYKDTTKKYSGADEEDLEEFLTKYCAQDDDFHLADSDRLKYYYNLFRGDAWRVYNSSIKPFAKAFREACQGMKDN